MQGLFNFKPSVRPVPLDCHIQGYPGKFYCPRMATMNKPAYAAIQTYAPTKPVLVFVSSRRACLTSHVMPGAPHRDSTHMIYDGKKGENNPIMTADVWDLTADLVMDTGGTGHILDKICAENFSGVQATDAAHSAGPDRLCSSR